MNTILIAEDEKFIRMGLKTMVQRSSVPVGEILEARDGEEALGILRERQVDLLITDIRMPKMDGIQLVGQLNTIGHRPMVMVVSGYDDFSYAVEMLRSGASDYLLKPVERERLYEALEKLEEQFLRRQAADEERGQQTRRVLRQLMLEPAHGGPEWEKLAAQCAGRFFPGPYVGFCAGECTETLRSGALCLRGTGRELFCAVPAEEAEQLAAVLPLPAGRGGVCQGLEQLHLCYQRAYAAWQRSFFSGTLCEAPEEPPQQPIDPSARQLAGLVGLARGQEAIRLLRGEAHGVAQGEKSPDAFARLCADLIRQLSASYQNLVELAGDPERFARLWDFPSCQSYLEELEQWMDAFCGKAAEEFSDYENKQKIRQGVQYIQQHFREPLNMAVVSNHVSMNYSLFSLLFKQYTGGNFVSYLQKLRIDEAKRLLETTDWRVNEIGRNVGFSDEKHFLKVFKSTVGLSPTEYRKSALLLQQNAPKDET
ncbi:MAG: response regulator [Clostridiales bacterium]|nr:response regulator [Clostridiales bacterium]